MNKASAAQETRVDRWLWAVRICKTRTAATDACRGGHVKVNGAPAKAATLVRAGDRVEAYIHERDRVLEVLTVIETRVGAPVAEGCYADHSPVVEREARLAPLFARERGTGRPTKRDRRQLDQLRQGS